MLNYTIHVAYFDDTELMLPKFKELFSLVTRVLFTLKYFECGNIVIWNQEREKSYWFGFSKTKKKFRLSPFFFGLGLLKLIIVLVLRPYVRPYVPRGTKKLSEVKLVLSKIEIFFFYSNGGVTVYIARFND